MICGGILKYVAAFVMVQVTVQTKDIQPKDGISRRGIVIKMYNETESSQFTDQVYMDGVTFIKSGPHREKEIASGRFLATLQRYVQQNIPTFGFEFLMLTRLTGSKTSQFVTGAKLLPLIHDGHLDDGVIWLTVPSGLEFVMANKECAFIKFHEAVVSTTYYCGNDNYIAYT